MKTSIKLKKAWFAHVASDGGVGTDWQEIQEAQREATVQFNGSDADVTNYKNVLGNTLESAKTKGDKTLNFQFADLTPVMIAEFAGGVVTSDSDADTYEAPDNENQSIELSIKFLTDKNVMYTLPRVSFDSYPMINDDDLHYYQVNGVVMKPEKTGVKSYKSQILKQPDNNDILTFVLEEQTGAAVISAVTHTVAIEVEIGTVVTALVPEITTSMGASILPYSGDAQNFTAPVVYTVESANGDSQEWTVTVTVAS
jgi:hypothetical protein